MSRPEAGVVPGTLGRGGQPSLLAEIKTYIFNLCNQGTALKCGDAPPTHGLPLPRRTRRRLLLSPSSVSYTTCSFQPVISTVGFCPHRIEFIRVMSFPKDSVSLWPRSNEGTTS